MTCETVRLPGGRRRAAPKCRCGRPATLLCDHPSGDLAGVSPAPPGPGGKTCDKPVCPACVVEVGPDRHHCPAHRQGVLL